MARERSAGSRANLELARGEVAGSGKQMRRGVACGVPFLAVALRAVFEIQVLARLPLRLGPDVGTLRAHWSRGSHPPRREQDSDSAKRQQARDHSCAASRARTAGLSPVKS